MYLICTSWDPYLTGVCWALTEMTRALLHAAD
jgi:hypothetical protein